MSALLDRRAFVSGLSGLFAAAVLVSPLEVGAKPRHVLSDLTDVRTREKFEPDERFGLVITMTAEQLYSDCGAAFVGVATVMTYAQGAKERVRPILIMPNADNQPDPTADDNLRLATITYKGLGFTILTGDLEAIEKVSSKMDDVFEIDAFGKVTGHSRDVHFLTPHEGKVLLRSPPEDPALIDTVQGLVEGCNKPEARALCR